MTRPDNLKKKKKIGASKLREMFNDPAIGGLLRRRTTQEITSHEGFASIYAGEPPGTMSLIKEWYCYNESTERTELLAAVHYYQRPDGTVGGSGKMDPKTLLVDGTRYIDP